MSVAILGDPESLGIPVSTVRQWTTALAPRGGGWDYIVQAFNYGSSDQAEWVVVNLDTGVAASTLGPAGGIYANSNFGTASANTLVTDNNQLRAPNGRIFFLEASAPLDQTKLNVAYFDPTDRQVHQVAQLTDPNNYRHAVGINAIYNPGGTVLYCGSQAVIGDLPLVYTVDPVTLAIAAIGPVGVAASVNPKYAYYLARDVGNNWLYVAVAQDPWELVKIDVTTGVQTVLATLAGEGQHIEFQDRAGLGWEVTLTQANTQSSYWLADGALSAYPGAGAPPGGARTVTPYAGTLTSPPDIDWSRGIGFVLWRPYGSSGAYSLIEYSYSATKTPIAIESLAVVEGDVYGNVAQYGGFWRRAGQDTTWFGQWPNGVSQPVMLKVDGKLYIAGYPNGALYLYDPSSEWAPTGDVAGNPSLLGTFGLAHIKHAYSLRIAGNNKLYAMGSIEREAVGTGFGMYDPSTNVFSGVGSGYEEYTQPRGMVILDNPVRVVYSGERASGTAQLITFDSSLVETSRLTVDPALLNTGVLFTTPHKNVVVGVSNDAPFIFYRADVERGVVLQTARLTGPLDQGMAQSDDGYIWVVDNHRLVRIDPTSLAVTDFGSMAGRNILFMEWSGSDLYLADDAELLRMVGQAGAAPSLRGVSPWMGDCLPDMYRRAFRKRNR